VIAEERRLTYGELAGEAEAVAAWLRRCGARSGGLVAVVMEKGWEQVVAVLGVLQAGAAYLPVDPSLPAERIRFLLAQCEPGLALTQRRVDRAVAWPASFARLCVDEELPREGAPHTGSPPSVEDLAYVIFTSGSTGTPKGVMISHRGAVNTILDVNERFAVGPRDRVLALSSLSFDLSVYDLFGPLAAGGAIVLPPSSDSRDPARWLELSRRERVTVWNSVPALAQLLVEYVEGHGETIGETLRLVLMSGDWIPVGLPDALRARAPRACVMSLGGATEASIWSILHPTDRLAPGAPSIPYGKAMANQRVYVLDDTLAPRPVWVPGEIYIGGDGVADGYFRDPERTAERFVRSPRTGERLYRTGDIGRLLPDGAIEFLGREDAQVKVQGFRIELGEIERALERAPGVRAAVVVPVGERHGAKSLIAYVVPADASARPDADDLRRSVAATLPAYMVPTRLLFVEGLPLTANGKVDRGALARFDAGERPAFVAPRNPAEAALAALWSEVLGVERIGVHDDFFALGGHSLLAVRLGALIAARSRRELSIGALLSHPTLAAQAALLRQSDIDAEPRNLVCLAPADADSPDRPIVLVHPVGGNVVCYRELAGLLRRCGAVYGIQSSDAEEGPTSLPEMAQRYVAALREAQPRGPYRLGGWSLGGFVAMEMARLLHAAGDDIELLFVIDSRMPSASAAVDRAQLLARFVGDLCGGTIPSSTALLAQLRSVADKEAIAEAHRVALAAGILPGELSPEAFARMYRLFERNARALLVYRPPRCELLVHAFCAETVLPGYDDALGWEASRRAVHRAAGDHYGVMRSPSLERIAATLREALASTHDRAG